MFIRRLYYGTQTGETLHSYVMSGDIVILPADEVAAGLGLTNYAYMEWLEPDQAIEDSFARSYGRVSIDVAQEPHELIFDTSEPPEPYNEYADMKTALGILGVMPVEVTGDG